MKQLKKFKPEFWDHRDVTANHSQSTFNFRKKWKLLVLFTSVMALSPLIVMTIVEFNLTRNILEKEVILHMSKVLTAAQIAVSSSDKPLQSVLDQFEPGEDNDLFVVDSSGSLLSRSFYYEETTVDTLFFAKVFTKEFGITHALLPDNTPIVIGYTRIPKRSQFIVLVKTKESMANLWFKPRLKLIGYLVISIIIILLSIMGTATYLVRRIHSADRKRLEAVHHAEYANKLASIGRLASGVAHEINNPLAIINQKTGLILDLLSMNGSSGHDERLIPLANDVISAVTRCGSITRRLLDFARHMEPSIEIVDIREVIEQVIAFLEKDAQKKHITIQVDVKKSIPGFESDKGSLQQICLNLFENAIAAMDDGGKLSITVTPARNKDIVVTISDTGRGISQEDIPKIFEPFYSSKDEHWGAGLGLSITYGLVKEIGGDITVKSKIAKGTRFTLTLPLKHTSVGQKTEN